MFLEANSGIMKKKNWVISHLVLENSLRCWCKSGLDHLIPRVRLSQESQNKKLIKAFSGSFLSDSVFEIQARFRETPSPLGTTMFQAHLSFVWEKKHPLPYGLFIHLETKFLFVYYRDHHFVFLLLTSYTKWPAFQEVMLATHATETGALFCGAADT